MIDVDCVRRNYSLGHFDPGYMMGANTMMPGIGSQHIDPRVLVHWNQPSAGHQLQSPTPPASAKSDEDEDEDEERPFTPPPPRERLSYTRYQLELLNGIYEEVRYPNSTQKQLIAKRVGITREQVKIWFQNRRRKDVIGNPGKPKICDTSTSSTSSSGKESDQQNSPPQNSPIPDDSGIHSSDETGSQKDAEQSVVPSLVMKSVIGELIKFTNDPLKGKKKRKKAKSKQQDKSAIKKGLTSTLLNGAYDMISPPNQITPTAFFEKIKNGFSHSKNASAFAVPGDVSKPSQICSVSSTSETGSGNITVSSGSAVNNSRTLHNYHMASSGRTYPTASFMNTGFPMPTYTTSMSTDLPVLTDILSYKSSLDMRTQNDRLKSAPQPLSSALPSTPVHRPETNKPAQPSHMHPFTPGRSLNGIFPYPFLAEPSMMLSSLRQADHIFRPSPHYPMSHYSDDPYQPLFITSLSNPYYSPPSGAWNPSHPVPHPMPHSTSSYTQL